jgi:hypothetical protein
MLQNCNKMLHPQKILDPWQPIGRAQFTLEHQRRNPRINQTMNQPMNQ